MDEVDIKRVENPDGEFYEVSYNSKGKRYSCVVQKSRDIVKILIYNRDRDAFVLTKQFRPFLYINHPEYAYKYELCGGGEDKNIGSYQTAIEEILEETGYRVDSLEKITTLYTTSKMTLYYSEVDDSMIENSGGGIEDEDIEIIYLPIKDAKEFMFNENIPKRPGLMFAFCWWFNLRGDK